MPERYEGMGFSLLYPETWKVEEESGTSAVTLESPEGAFMTVTRFTDTQDPQSAIESAQRTMEEEYEEVETEANSKQFGAQTLTGITQRFIYLDLIVTSQLLAFVNSGSTYLIQIQGEDRDLERLEQVFDAILTSMCQTLVTTEI